jgi:hypothetical protein
MICRLVAYNVNNNSDLNTSMASLASAVLILSLRYPVQSE